MRELELDGIHDDGEHLLLLDSDGERYTLRIDEALRAAVRRDRPALGMIQAADAAPLSPRQIQAQLRAGRSAEEIAEPAGISVEHVRRYEGPVLAEREWTAGRARTFPVGRGGPSLTSVVAERLAARQAADDVAWDAWRRPDGTWTLELSFSAAGRTRQAHWVADLDNRSLSPVDDEARWISDEDAPSEPVRGRARLQAVKTSVYDLEADGSFDESATSRRAADRSGHPAAFDEAELAALNARRGLRSVPPLDEDDAPAVWSALDEDETAPARHEPAPEDTADTEEVDPADREAEQDHSRWDTDDALPSPSEDDEDTDVEDPALEDSAFEDTDLEDAPSEASDGDPAPADEQADASPAEALRYEDTVDLTPLPGFDDPAPAAGTTDDGDTEQETPAPAAKKAAKKPAKKGRASMPSWDEIVFGAKHD